LVESPYYFGSVEIGVGSKPILFLHDWQLLGRLRLAGQEHERTYALYGPSSGQIPEHGPWMLAAMLYDPAEVPMLETSVAMLQSHIARYSRIQITIAADPKPLIIWNAETLVQTPETIDQRPPDDGMFRFAKPSAPAFTTAILFGVEGLKR
jgi:hypothetical protein